MENKKRYYAYTSRDGITYCVGEYLDPFLMSGDYLLFDSAEECVEYWKKEGVGIDRYV